MLADRVARFSSSNEALHPCDRTSVVLAMLCVVARYMFALRTHTHTHIFHKRN